MTRKRNQENKCHKGISPLLTSFLPDLLSNLLYLYYTALVPPKQLNSVQTQEGSFHIWNLNLISHVLKITEMWWQNITGLQNNLRITQLTTWCTVEQASEVFSSQFILFTWIQWGTNLIVTGCPPAPSISSERERRWRTVGTAATYKGLS